MNQFKVIGKINLDGYSDEEIISLAKETTRERHGSNFKFTIMKSIDKKTASRIQGQLSYHPAGYGFHSFDATLTKTTWCCWDSCD